MDIDRINVEDIYALSPMQQGMLFHSLYNPRAGVYSLHLVFDLHGDLNITAFKQAWEGVVDQHPILRTAFIWEGLDDPVQVVCRSVRLPWEEHDWRELSLTEQRNQLEAHLELDRRNGFELDRAPLMRLALIRKTVDNYQLVWSFHLSLLDGWSKALVLKEVFARYHGLCQGRELHLEGSRSYKDYIAWLQQQDLPAAEKFWRQALQGFTAATPLAAGRAVGGSTGEGVDHAEEVCRLSATSTSALQGIARQHRLTLNTLVQGSWALLLGRYSGEEDVLFGAVVSGRAAALPGVESMVGCFINTLPVRVQVSEEESCLTWLQRLQAQLIELRQYEYSPLVQVQGWSDVQRGLSLFESLMLFENYPVESAGWDQASGLEIRNTRGFEQTHYPLTIVAVPGPELLLRVSYDCSRFEAATIRRMLGHLQNLLEGVVADPEQRISGLPLLTEPERRQLLVEWNHTQCGYPEDRCIHELFEAQAEKTPEAVAVVFEGQQLTYRELNARANQLAHYLRKRGVGPEVLVGLCLERSLEMVVGLLGVLKAGGAYVPLDPAYPRERLAFMLEDAKVPVLLTQQKLLESLPGPNAEVVCLDSDWAEIAQESEQEPVGGASAQNLAYVIYTSGSTGRPKGVQVLHGGVVNILDSMRWQPVLASQDRLLAVTTLSFDIAALELYLPLIVGACLEVVSHELASDGIRLLERLAGSGVTVMQATPATWRLLLKAGWQGGGRLKVICGGEALSRDLADELLSRSASVWNLYGPTETTIWSAAHQVQPGQGPVPLGRPVANTKIYLLDRRLRPVPIGVAGEVHIGGLGVARGYLNRPELSAEKFVPNPFGGEPGTRLYKTGDLARYREDGNIEYLGRLDHQVKLRGFRIELGEVEAALGQHPAVGQAVVLAREDAPGDRRLVAYMVLRRDPAPVISELRSFLKQRLPDYMVPSAFVPLQRLPLTPSGKVDRRNLPAPDQARPDLGKAFVAPRSPVEEVLAGIWREVLGVEQVGVHDNFFELGGHSLLATQVISRLRHSFQVNLPLRCLFEAPTVADLAMTISQMHAKSAQHDELGRTLAELEELSEEEAQELLTKKTL
jgi:amino acid adenylation domain-containing protein